ncbi:MFS transporter, PPP family, 3-phenylpropionic acid transporter [Thalassobacillus cyri]|uniref:MFS transporter, PPP family, 3-phenylpropionic acid transporter n=1 Tax=Thalassobacillus cyri TaxID=571932 RepID=A0A1H4BF87_9BACI|nr:MFS transporter [Thalassobacillus cyri]SEA46833.1 MFS transporter, PPP family, 3-phenylpropionic acid transporter [Thalassobacillus cyri]
MQQYKHKTYRFFQIYYFFTFFGFGALFPLLSIFLEEEKGLNHTQIGLIIAALPLVTIFIQPIWGMISDHTKRTRRLLAIATFLAAILALLYPLWQGFIVLYAGMLVIAVFQSAIVPLSDSLSLSYVQQHGKQYGNIRLWGAIGFAVAVFVLGRVTEVAGSLNWVFVFFSGGLILALLSLSQFPKHGEGVAVSFREGLKVLTKQKSFMIFLISNFLVFGPVLANNYYFGTFILTVGGTLTAVGIAFLFAAGSEAPFMKISQFIIDKLGIFRVLIISSSVSFIRWLIYAFEPSSGIVYTTTIMQGVSVGLYIPAALILVRELAPKGVIATAVGLYSAVGNGLGNAFFTFIGGVWIDALHVFGMYGFFSAMTFTGVILIVVVSKREGKQIYIEGG